MKQLFSYLLVFIAALIAANFLYALSGQEKKDAVLCGALLHNRIDSLASTVETIYFGESSNFTTAKTDTLKSTISELVSTYSNKKVAVIEQGALHAGIYKTLIERIKPGSTVKNVIITVNLRSFGINWIESKLETNLARAQVIYSTKPALVKKILIAFKWYNRREEFQRKETIKWAYKYNRFSIPSNKYNTVRDWDGVVFHAGVKTSKGIIDRDTTNLACHFIKNYAFALDQDNPRLQDFEQIADYCSKNNINLYLHILPENFERAKELIGEDLCYLMQQNISFLKNHLSAKAILVDNSQLLSKERFIDLDWPTEHYDQEGRTAVAEQISKVLSGKNSN